VFHEKAREERGDVKLNVWTCASHLER